MELSDQTLDKEVIIRARRRLLSQVPKKYQNCRNCNAQLDTDTIHCDSCGTQNG